MEFASTLAKGVLTLALVSRTRLPPALVFSAAQLALAAVVLIGRCVRACMRLHVCLAHVWGFGGLRCTCRREVGHRGRCRGGRRAWRWRVGGEGMSRSFGVDATGCLNA